MLSKNAIFLKARTKNSKTANPKTPKLDQKDQCARLGNVFFLKLEFSVLSLFVQCCVLMDTKNQTSLQTPMFIVFCCLQDKTCVSQFPPKVIFFETKHFVHRLQTGVSTKTNDNSHHKPKHTTLVGAPKIS